MGINNLLKVTCREISKGRIFPICSETDSIPNVGGGGYVSRKNSRYFRSLRSSNLLFNTLKA